ncbi:MAG TPA: aminotransferase class III-fold pyridoxal phosphate-dependent enzyme, partial [Actinomycetota bacterium]|nr:aminotransferase class III-fold pyridoxal phosphate-dependent enzyme [Actinomycetota bacterium]
MPTLPGPRSKEWIERREQAVPRAVFNTLPVFIESVEPAAVIDADGNRFIDFAAGLGVLNIGRGNQRVVEAVREQVEKFLHECFHVAMYPGYVELAEALNRVTPGDHAKKTMLANSGAEAVENAVKIARYATGRQAVVCFSNGFSGRTLLAMTLTAKEIYKRGYGPYAPEVYRLPFPYEFRPPFDTSGSVSEACAAHLVDVIDHEIGSDRVACVVIEPVQGEGGYVVCPPEFMTLLRSICSERDILLVDDEIQSGMGRTAKMFAIEHFDVVPDIVTTAKSLGAGLPVSGVTGRAEAMEAPHVGGLGGTYGGNPVACAAAVAVITELENSDVLARAEKQGRSIRERLDPLEKELDLVGEVRGLGPMIGLELISDTASKEPASLATAAVMKRCHEN